MKKILSCLLCVLLMSTLFTAHAENMPASGFDFSENDNAPFVPYVYAARTSGAAKQAPGPAPTPMPSPIPPPVQSGETDPSRPMIALTFDDGPSRHTPRILDILERHGGRATFFTVGYLLSSNKETVLRASKMGCEIIGHTWDHKDLTKLSDAEIRNQLLTTNNTIEAITGTAKPMFRPPYGAVDARIQRISRELGFSIITWSLDTLDWQSRNADAVHSAVMHGVKDRDIILTHDMHGTTADSMEIVIPDLISRGYQLVTVSELLAYKYGSIEAGRIYTN